MRVPPQLLILSVQLLNQRFFKPHMEAIKRQDQPYIASQQHAQLSMSFHLPIHAQLNNKFGPSKAVNQHYIYHHLPPARVNRSEGGRRLADIRGILSKSLFDKAGKKNELDKQKVKDSHCGNRFDNLPISPQTEEKSSTRLINFLRMKNIAIQPKLKTRGDVKLLVTSEEETSVLNSMETGELICNQQVQKDPNEARQFLDQKFNNLLQINFAEQGDMSLDIESRFALRRHKRNKQDVEYVQTCLTDDRAAIHQKLLQEENLYIRQQLIRFTKVIQTERKRAQEYKSTVKVLKRENEKVKSQNSQFKTQYLHREQSINLLSLQNNQYLKEVLKCTEEKNLLQRKLETLLRQYEILLCKLQQSQHKQRRMQQIMDECGKQKQLFLDQLRQKDKEILELNEIIHELRVRISTQAGKNEQLHCSRVDVSIDSNSARSEDNSCGEQGMKMTSSICLSLAEAQSLKNIIQEKQQSFHHEIQSLKILNSQNEQKYQKIIEELKQSLVLMQQTKIAQIEQIKQSYNAEIEKLKVLVERNSTVMSKQIIDQQERKSLLINQIKLLEERLEENLKEEDEELEELLQNCVNQLEKERHTNFLLLEEYSEEKRANHLMREEIERLKSFFNRETNELYVIQEAEGKSQIN